MTKEEAVKVAEEAIKQAATLRSEYAMIHVKYLKELLKK